MAVPETAVDSIKDTLVCVEDLETNLLRFVSAAEPDVIAALPPLQRARAFLMLSKAASTLLSVRLRCNGIRPDDHAINTELERLRLCEGKLQRCSDRNDAPLKPSTTLNRQAAARFIGHSLPGLSPGQRQSISEISSGKRNKFSGSQRISKKQKQSAYEKQSPQEAAQEFLEKATLELLGSNNGGVKGPLQIGNCNEDEEEFAN